MINVEDKELLVALYNMSWKKMNSVYAKALKKSLEPIQKQAKMNLRKSGIKGVSKKHIGKNGKQYPSMISGIKTSVNTKQEDGYGKVHLMGEYRLKFFEMGTAIRKTRKGYNRGSIAPKWYFADAVREKGNEAVKSLDDNIRIAIKKAWEKKV